MARLPRFRHADGSAQPPPAKSPRRSLPHPGVLRRERRSLQRAREERLRDLGGLMLEMYRRDQFRQDLLVERCDELIALDDRLQELDSLLAAAVSSRRAAPAARCACGAPIVAGAHFCANCGRAVAAAPAVITCASCGAPLPAEATYCAACGAKVEPVSKEPAGEPAPAAAADRWET